MAAPHQIGNAIAQEAVPGAVNESAYELADCWRTLNASSCEVCLENAPASILECLPWSEGRVLNTGCFMRYSDKDFLNKELGTQSSKGNQNLNYCCTCWVKYCCTRNSLLVIIVKRKIVF